MRLRWVQLLDNEGRPRSNISRTEGLTARICYDINAPIRDVHVVCHISDLEDRVVLSTGDCDVGRSISERSEEHTSELQSLMRISYAVFCLKNKKARLQSRHKFTKKIPTTDMNKQ